MNVGTMSARRRSRKVNIAETGSGYISLPKRGQVTFRET
jgi:hypothetical protein